MPERGQIQLKPILCLNCKWQIDGRCTQFDFKADMRKWKDSAWCKSGAPRDEMNTEGQDDVHG